MTSATNEIAVKPEIMLLEQVLEEIAAGRLRVPKFQRPFVWRPEQMTNLFDSIERGYPIGSLLVWETDLQLPSLDRIADIDLPSSKGKTVSYVLDGHQRLSTLYGTLARRPKSDDEERGQQEWMWSVYRVLGEHDDRANKFRHWKQFISPPENFLPLRAVLRTMDFLAYARDLSKTDRSDLNELVEEAEELALRIKSYKMAVVRLVGGDLSHAVEVFSRLNSSGQSMTPDQMVSALTYGVEGGESLADRIVNIQESLADVGYGQIPSITIFRSILAIAGEEDVQEARWEILAQRVKDKLSEAVDIAEVALRQAVDFLRDVLHVPLARLVPYNAQIMLLVAFFAAVPEPTVDQINMLRRWFWSTSWSGYFAGANTTQIKLALQEMREFAAGKSRLDLGGQIARPFPNRFDMRSARIRAFLIWEVKTFGRRLDLQGDVIDVTKLLASSDTSAYRHVLSRGPLVSNPANRLVLPTSPGISVRRALLDSPPNIRDAILESHGIPYSAFDRLEVGDLEGFISDRSAFLANLERTFMREIGVELSSTISGEADIDAE